MLISMNQNQSVAAGERSLIVRRRFSSIPLVFNIDIASVDGTPPTGTVERVGSRWIFGRTRMLVPLGARNRVEKGFWDTFFDVYVIPDRPVQVTMGRTRTSNRFNLGVLAAIVLVIALAVYYVASAS
jgi:hypothetical protein